MATRPSTSVVDPDKLLIGVVAHDSRETTARTLTERVGAQVFNMDHCRARTQEEAVSACVANHLEVLRQLQERSTVWNPWCIVLEDDALPVDNFRIHAAAALYHVRSPLAGFYIGRAGANLNLKALERARRSGIAWAVSNHMNSAVAYAIRTDELPAIIDYYRHDVGTVERRITNWAITRRSKVFGEPRFYYTLPSLVDHAPGKSIVFDKADGDIRRAWCVGIADWNTPAVEYDPQ